MAKYLIHSYKDRQWYVDKYLIPSMVKQGIDRGDIDIFEDDGSLGCLEAFMQSCLMLEPEGGTWHLQDDVIISSQFKRWTEEYAQNRVVCGFCSRYSKKCPPGLVYPDLMWYSFPCIYIPNVLAREFATWFYRETIYNPHYESWISKKKFEDSIFMDYLQQYCPGKQILNLAPNIVNHIDYLLGGSIVNSNRVESIVHSIYWEEPELLSYWQTTIQKEEPDGKDI